MKKPHYAWAVCAGCTLMLFIAGGLAVNAFSVLQPYILTVNGFTNTQTSMITTVRSVAYLLCMVLTPVFYKLFSYRLGTTVATLLSPIAFVIFATAKTIGMYYLAGVVVGLSYGFGSVIPVAVLISRWFHEKQGLALGITSAGTGLATVVFSPILSLLTERFSLSVCFWVMAAICFVGTAAVWLLIRDDPESCGLLPFGEKADMPKLTANREPARLSRTLWVLLILSMAFMGAISSPCFAHFMILFTSSGVPETVASGAISIFGLALMTGKFLFGSASDRIGTRNTNWIFSFLLLVGLTLCLFAGSGSVKLMYVSSVLFGSGVAIGSIGLTIWARDMSAPEELEKAVRRFQTSYAVGSLAFSFVPGVIADQTGSYVPAYAMFLAEGVFSVAVVQYTYYRKMGKKA